MPHERYRGDGGQCRSALKGADKGTDGADTGTDSAAEGYLEALLVQIALWLLAVLSRVALQKGRMRTACCSLDRAIEGTMWSRRSCRVISARTTPRELRRNPLGTATVCIYPGTGLAPATSAPGPGLRFPKTRPALSCFRARTHAAQAPIPAADHCEGAREVGCGEIGIPHHKIFRHRNHQESGMA